MKIFTGYAIESVLPLVEGHLWPYLIDRIENAKKRTWGTIFIINPLVAQDPELKVRALLKALERAAWRGVDVRIVIGQPENPDIFVPCQTALSFLRSHGVATHFFNSTYRESTHSKYLIVDGEVILGSHNWSHMAFSKNIEASLAVRSSEFSRALRFEFLNIWKDSQS